MRSETDSLVPASHGCFWSPQDVPYSEISTGFMQAFALLVATITASMDTRERLAAYAWHAALCRAGALVVRDGSVGLLLAALQSRSKSTSIQQ